MGMSRMEPRKTEGPEASAARPVESPNVSVGKGLALVGRASGVGMSAGFLTAAFTIGGLFLGMWVDRMLGTRPAFTLTFILGSIPLSLVVMVWFVLRNARRVGQAEQDRLSSAKEP
jgi:F0F1-type ATP synthase assembly protein I